MAMLSLPAAGADRSVEEALHAAGLARTVTAVVSSFSAALAIARSSELVALVPLSFLNGIGHGPNEVGTSALRVFPLPVRTEPITVSQMWHPRMEADLAHRWLRGVVLAICGGSSRLRQARRAASFALSFKALAMF